MEVHGQLMLSANARLLETQYKRSKIAFDVTLIAFTVVHICTELLQIPAKSLIGSPGTLIFTIVRQAPALTLYKRVLLSPSPHTCTLCPMFSLDLSVVGLEPPCTCWRKDTITRLCASHTVSHDRRRACLFFLPVHQSF